MTQIDVALLGTPGSFQFRANAVQGFKTLRKLSFQKIYSELFLTTVSAKDHFMSNCR